MYVLFVEKKLILLWNDISVYILNIIKFVEIIYCRFFMLVYVFKFAI